MRALSRGSCRTYSRFFSQPETGLSRFRVLPSSACAPLVLVMLGKRTPWKRTFKSPACQAYAKKAGYEVAGVFQEAGVSGVTDETERAAFQDIMPSTRKFGFEKRTVWEILPGKEVQKPFLSCCDSDCHIISFKLCSNNNQNQS
jgi:hypothetical protein